MERQQWFNLAVVVIVAYLILYLVANVIAIIFTGKPLDPGF